MSIENIKWLEKGESRKNKLFLVWINICSADIYLKNKNILDAGYGLDWETCLIFNYPKELIGIDTDEKSLKFAKKK